MSYSIYYPGCATAIPDHLCNTCGDDKEHGRVRSVAFITESYLPTLMVDPTSPVKWQAGIATKAIVIVPEVIGSFDGGAPQEGPGYGDSDSELLGYKFGLAYKDPNYKLNAAFYNAIKRSRRYAVAWRSESQIHISDKTARITPKNPIAEDLNSDVVWDVAISFSQPDLPVPFDVPPGIFDSCFAYA